MSVISLSFMAFTAVVFLGYFILPMKVRPYWLLLTSLYFYGCFGWDGFILLTLSVVTTFAAAHIVTKLKRNGAKKLVLTLTVILNAGILTAVKYLNYSLSLLGRIIELPVKEVSLIVSLGIAFYTMQAISYLVDVYRGKYPPARNFFKYFCYMTYFPIIMQGPISRYDQLADQLFTPHRFSFDRMKSGLSLTLWGLFKKMVIADRAALLVNEVFGNYTEYAGLEIVTAALMYTVQIYTDFSGCVDISRGISEVLGIKLIENFKHPYQGFLAQMAHRAFVLVQGLHIHSSRRKPQGHLPQISESHRRILRQRTLARRRGPLHCVGTSAGVLPDSRRADIGNTQ